jgi:hypothetical protein
MTARQRYQVAFFALGWLLAIGLLLQGGLQRSISLAYASMSGQVSGLVQSLSNAEGEAWKKQHGRSRKDQLRPWAALLASPEMLKAPETLLFGAYDGGLPHSFAGLDALEQTLEHRFPIVSVYQAWGDQPEHQFPRRIVETIDRLGSVPMITWEPWVTVFDERRYVHLPPKTEREYSSLEAIARGDYNFYLMPWAKAAAAYGKPLFLRFAHEMNDPYRYPWGPQNGNRPEEFIAAWRQVHSVFEQAGAANVLWVWSPHISAPWFEYYYPGDDVVDWVGATILNYGDTAPWSRWWSFDQIFNKAYPALEKLGKPIVISEFGTTRSGGDPVEWYRMALDHLEAKFSEVKMVVLFNQTSDTTITATPINWSVADQPRVAQLFRSRLAAVTETRESGATAVERATE